MKISRWIYFPLIYTLFYISWMMIGFFLLDMTLISFNFAIWLLNGLVTSFLILYFSYRSAKKLSNNSDDERIHHVRQNRQLIVLIGFEKAFKLCREAILSLRKGTIKEESFESGEIKASCRLRWDMAGNKIEVRLKRINENLTEIEVNILPPWKTVVADSGHSWKIAEDICDYIKQKDAEYNKNVLADSVSIMEDVYVKPFQKEKIER